MNYSTSAQSYANAGHTRYASAHASSSAFSASANPNEDWTKVSDLAERRRIQNRIAQRNYRKKLKRRLEDLERRAGSSSASPEQAHSELAISTSSQKSRSQPHSQSSHSSTRKGSQSNQSNQYQSPETPSNFEESLFGRQTPRQLSASPPPPFNYSAYVPEKSSFYWSEPTFGGLPTNYSENAGLQEQYYSGLLTPRTNTTSHAPQKEENPFGDDSFMNPFSMTYASMTGIDVPMSQGYTDFGAHTPPLTDPLSFGDSRESSPTQLVFPGTPFSLAESPKLSVYGTS